jgi:hypothetical protein
MSRRPVLLSLALLVLLARPIGATWSIVLVDTKTGEVGVSACTCLEGLDLLKLLPVMVAGHGGGAAQSAIDTSCVNRKKMHDQLLLGTPPADIIPILLDGDLQKKVRQYGIADLSPAAAGYTGGGVLNYKQDITGTVGTITYAIQGNVLTGMPVITAAEAAVVNTPGTLADKLIAGMEAARSMGGDGRCSCDPDHPQQCGSPPPNFTKAADIGFMVVSRIGDTDGPCNAAVGCASGDYWLKLNVAFQFAADPDPVLQLESLYAGFKAGLAGHPDGIRSLAGFDHDALLADGQSTRTLTIALYDADGAAITQGGAAVTVTHAPGSAGLSTIGAVRDNGDGTYTADVGSASGTGTDLLEVRVDDGSSHPATLYPFTPLQLRTALLADGDELSAAQGGNVALDLLGPSSAAGRGFAVALSAAGDSPGQQLGSGLHLPLNFDRVFALSPTIVAAGMLSGVPGRLDGASHAVAALAPPPGAFAALVGLPLTCAWFTLHPADFASNAIQVQIDP